MCDAGSAVPLAAAVTGGRVIEPAAPGAASRGAVPRPPPEEEKQEQKAEVERLGARSRVVSGEVDLSMEAMFGSALWWGDEETARKYARQLASREGPLLRLQTGAVMVSDVMHERHLCIDTTASGGNAQLLAQVARE